MTTIYDNIIVENEITTNSLLLNGINVNNEIIKSQNVSNVTGESTGFADRTTSTISFNNTTRTFTISPVASTFDYYIKGIKYTVSTKSITIPNTSNVYFIYLDENEDINYSNSFSDEILKDYVYVSNFYWSTTQNRILGLAEERHGLVMDWKTHSYLHNYVGARIRPDMFTIGNFVLNGDGSSNSHCQASIENGVLADEDISMSIIHSATPTNSFEQELSTIAKLPFLYKNGSEWYYETNNTYLVKTGTNRIQYNFFNGSSWSTVDATENYFVAVWIFATNYQDEPIRILLGQREDDTITNAQTNNAYESLNLSGLPTQEYKVLYRLIFQTSSSFTNTPHAKLVEILNLRKSIDQNQVITQVDDHGQLSGLSDDDHQQYLNVTRGDSRYYTQTQTNNLIQNASNITSGTLTNNVLSNNLKDIGNISFNTNDISIFNGTNVVSISPTSYKATLGLNNVTNNLQVYNLGNARGLQLDTISNRPAASTNGNIFISSDTRIISYDNGSTWANILPAYTGDVSSTVGGTTLTLATVNSNIGTFNNVTLNAKGLATSASNVNYLQDPTANGIVVRTALNTTTNRTITNTADQTTVTNGDGVAGNPTIGLANNPVIPGTESITLPIGTTAQRPTHSNGKMRFNSDTLMEEISESNQWRPLGRLMQFTTGNISQTTGTTIIPYDNTLPTSTEGFQIFTANITPFYNNSTIIVIYNIFYECSSINTVVTTTLLNGTTTIAASASRQATANQPNTLCVTKGFQSGTTSLITLSARIGPASASTVYVNRGSTETFGGSITTSYIIMEIY